MAQHPKARTSPQLVTVACAAQPGRADWTPPVVTTGRGDGLFPSGCALRQQREGV